MTAPHSERLRALRRTLERLDTAQEALGDVVDSLHWSGEHYDPREPLSDAWDVIEDAKEHFQRELHTVERRLLDEASNPKK